MAYTSVNESVWGDGGTKYEGHQQQVAQEQERRKNDPTLNQALTTEEKMTKYGDVINSTLGGLNHNSSTGYYTKNPGNAQSSGASVTEEKLPGTGENGWYAVQGQARQQAAGTSGADESFMTDGDYAILQQLKKEYAAAQAAGDKAAQAAAHDAAERLRAGYGYSGGSDGSQYLTFGELGIETPDRNQNDDGYGHGSSSGSGSGSSNQGLTNLLEQWKAAALEQSNGRIDYAVQQAITELERALEDAQPQFKEQAEAVAKDEMQALDNSALYAEARGDKGGIGKSQYNEIQAAAAQNRLAVQQAQTKLSTDTARQIADLRAQGEFEKADQALEISQQYLSQLIGLEQWAAEFGLSQAQFQESIRQWEAEYDLAMQQFKVDTDLSYAQLTGKLGDGTLTLNGQNQLASMGEAMLSAGIMPSAEQLSAMGMTESQAQAYLTAAQLEAASKGSGSKKGSGGEDEKKLTGAEAVYQKLQDAGYNYRSSASQMKAYLTGLGVTNAATYVDGFVSWDRDNSVKDTGNGDIDMAAAMEALANLNPSLREQSGHVGGSTPMASSDADVLAQIRTALRENPDAFSSLGFGPLDADGYLDLYKRGLITFG